MFGSPLGYLSFVTTWFCFWCNHIINCHNFIDYVATFSFIVPIYSATYTDYKSWFCFVSWSLDHFKTPELFHFLFTFFFFHFPSVCVFLNISLLSLNYIWLVLHIQIQTLILLLFLLLFLSNPCCISAESYSFCFNNLNFWHYGVLTVHCISVGWLNWRKGWSTSPGWCTTKQEFYF